MVITMRNDIELIKNMVLITPDNSQFAEHNRFIWTKDLLQTNRSLSPHHHIHAESFCTSLPDHENIYVLAHEVSEDFPLHSHDYIEIIYVLKGELLNTIDTNQIFMTQGDLCILNTKAIHELHCRDKDTIILNFCLQSSLFTGSLSEFMLDENPVSAFLREDHTTPQNYMYFAISYHHELQKIILNIIAEYRASGFHQSFSLDAYFLLLLHKLSRLGEYSYYGIDEKALKVVRFLKEQSLKHNLGEMADMLGYHPGYLSAYVKKHTGRNCKDLIIETKMQAAAGMLTESDTPIENIASLCGYQSVSHFFRLFQKYYNMTPSNYRRLYL